MSNPVFSYFLFVYFSMFSAMFTWLGHYVSLGIIIIIIIIVIIIIIIITSMPWLPWRHKHSIKSTISS